ncbi:MAG: competence/damage-inducible protein A [Candidatus Aminicenantaceae bacterium]
MNSFEMLKIEIIAIGSELLSPYFQETNSLYITTRLNEIGLKLAFKSIVGDNEYDLLHCINESLRRSHIVFAIGGLGPTYDDKTKEVFASVLERKLIFNQNIFDKIETRFNRRSIPMPQPSKGQAYVIEGAEVLENECGTAPGFWIDTGPNIIILLPGPPNELKPMFESSVWTRLKKYETSYFEKKTVKITGLTESKIETIISDLYNQDKSIKLSTLAKPGQIEIHILSSSKKDQSLAKKKIEDLVKMLHQRLKDNIISINGEELEEIVGNLLRNDNKTLAAAESCTGGYLSHRLTNIPGSSDYFLNGIIAYSNNAKTDLLNVPSELIEKHGAVSSAVAQAMAQGIRQNTGADFGLSITGIAGPSGGTEEKPVGLVYTGLSWDQDTEVEKNLFLGDRENIKFQSSQKALDMLRRKLIK